MIKNKIIVFEPNMNFYPHSEINAGILSLIELVYKNNKLVFKADKRHYNAIQEIREFNNWAYEPTKVLSYEPKFFLINDFILIFKITRVIFNLKKTDSLYLLGIMPLTHIFISFLNSLLKKQCFICLHGQMEAYLDNTNIGRSKHYYGLSKFTFKRNDNINYLFFGESIKNNLLFLFNSRKKLIVIDQPYIYKELKDKDITLGKKIYTFGMLGRFDYSKNIKEFFCFLNLMEHEILENKVVIKIIGKVTCEIPEKYRNLISFYDRSLTKEEFEKDVAHLDFVISFLSESYYRATPSGVFFDCIKWEIPILSLNNPFINYYFSKYDKVGEIFTNTPEMVEFIKDNLINSVYDFNNYMLYLKNLKKLKHFLSVEKLSEQFAKQI
jgi:hypothetical protein